MKTIIISIMLLFLCSVAWAECIDETVIVLNSVKSCFTISSDMLSFEGVVNWPQWKAHFMNIVHQSDGTYMRLVDSRKQLILGFVYKRNMLYYQSTYQVDDIALEMLYKLGAVNAIFPRPLILP